MADRRLILEELARRQSARQVSAGAMQAIVDELYDKQRRVATSKSRHIAALGSRRAGKTEMWPRIASTKALSTPRALVRVWSHARLRAKELLWNRIRYLVGRHGLKCKMNEVELSFRFENDSEIRLVGADKDKEIQKKRGDSSLAEIVLEAQNFGSLLRPLVEDVIQPSLIDLRGTVYLEGTPGPICAGYWYDITGGNDSGDVWQSLGPKEVSMFEVHRLTMLDNPFIPHARIEMEEMKARKGWADDNPTYLREWLGRWVNDLGSLYYSFDLLRNTYHPGTVQPWGPGWSHVLGWDLGGKDDMALVIWGWHEKDPTLYEVFSWKKPGALSNEVVEVIEEQERRKGLNIIKKVADTQGGGRMYVDDVMSRYNHSFENAKKSSKYDHVMLMNDDFVTGRIKVLLGSPLQEELIALMRDPDWDPKKPEYKDKPPTEDASCPNHCTDAGLYAHRAAYHYLPRVDPPKKTSVYEADEYEKQAIRKFKERSSRDWFDDVQGGDEWEW